MYALKNKVQLIGHLGNQPDVRTTETGKKWARFSVATSEVYRNAKGEKITETQWHSLIAWGKLINRSYADKEGIKKYVTEVQVNELLMLGAKAAAKQ